MFSDDELPDYIMVMVANKRSKQQMENDLELFLTDNTSAFTTWLHQVLNKLQEVTVSLGKIYNEFLPGVTSVISLSFDIEHIHAKQ